jgi:hypothetical protein
MIGFIPSASASLSHSLSISYIISSFIFVGWAAAAGMWRETIDRSSGPRRHRLFYIYIKCCYSLCVCIYELYTDKIHTFIYKIERVLCVFSSRDRRKSHLPTHPHVTLLFFFFSPVFFSLLILYTSSSSPSADYVMYRESSSSGFISKNGREISKNLNFFGAMNEMKG